jgi:hypothetical protein
MIGIVAADWQTAQGLLVKKNGASLSAEKPISAACAA